MKKIIVLFAAISTLTVASSCNKENTVKPAANAQKTIVSDKTDVGQGD
ncbi:hypothetical protein BDD43_4178 [Mucilaginibacter gracilis]|uniref:Uncharacterized protein n=1 Tax=Mucilaginibacter gracilis TaxID=423350 RepID=A0A495J5D5_9SPHI|nr:hypothetical protein [Mucilaginibacter gracilis]RKR83963.1 hypothetical protein BDD43_4178 [Mucilaginibacter gracilis]